MKAEVQVVEFQQAIAKVQELLIDKKSNSLLGMGENIKSLELKLEEEKN